MAIGDNGSLRSRFFKDSANAAKAYEDFRNVVKIYKKDRKERLTKKQIFWDFISSLVILGSVVVAVISIIIAYWKMAFRWIIPVLIAELCIFIYLCCVEVHKKGPKKEKKERESIKASWIRALNVVSSGKTLEQYKEEYKDEKEAKKLWPSSARLYVYITTYYEGSFARIILYKIVSLGLMIAYMLALPGLPVITRTADKPTARGIIMVIAAVAFALAVNIFFSVLEEKIMELVSLATYDDELELMKDSVSQAVIDTIAKDKDKMYPVVTLCGSTRFKKEFMEVQKKLTLEGNIVISVGLFVHSGDQEVWESKDEGTLTKTKEMLDDMHKRKIDLADSIYVINVGGYIGESTKKEIEYAKENGKDVKYLEE